MLKHIYRIIILIGIFIASLYYFSKDIKEVVFDIDNTTVMEEATFPLITIRTEGVNINRLHGYSSSLNANAVREALTPVGQEGTFEVLIDEKDYEIKKLNFEVREFIGNELVEKGSVSVFDEENDVKTAKIRLGNDILNEREYAVKITLVTSESKKIYYYSRIKKYESDNLAQKVNFVMEFHEAIKDKKKAEDYAKYLEPDRKKDNTSLASVNIHSSFDLITWGNLQPEFITEVIPTVSESYADISSFVLDYVIKSNVSGNPEFYRVKEYYRVRYSPSRMYLLNYERRMESLFDVSLANVQKKQLKLGITSDTDVPYVVSDDKKNVAFVRNRELWLYNLEDNQIVRVFSFRQENTDYIRDIYDQHDIRILNMDPEGNIDFMVYGYMNRGQYEGRVAIVLYEYIRAEQRIEEKVYIPVDEPFQKLKENMGGFAYKNSFDIFYFHIYGSIYAYNLITRQLTVLADNVEKDNVLPFYKEGYVVWQEGSDAGNASNIKIMDIETGNIKTIDTREGYKIILLDKIDSNIIYGFASEEEITTTVDGTVIIPLSRIEICTTQKEVLKSYQKDGYYITGVEVRDNIIKLYRAKKEFADGQKIFKDTTDDYIMSQNVENTSFLQVVSKFSETALTEFYMQLPSGTAMDKLPEIITTVNTVISEDPTLRITKDIKDMDSDKEKKPEQLKFYTFIMGELDNEYSEASDAIIKADEGAGVVISSLNHIVWERGVKANKSVLAQFENMSISRSTNSVESCIKLLARYTGKNIDNKSFDTSNMSAYEIIARYTDKVPVRLSGANLDQVLYYVFKGRPVIAMTGYNDAVLIYGYDSYNIYVIDPRQGKVVKMSLQTGSELFETAGNIFISYLE